MMKKMTSLVTAIVLMMTVSVANAQNPNRFAGSKNNTQQQAAKQKAPAQWNKGAQLQSKQQKPASAQWSKTAKQKATTQWSKTAKQVPNKQQAKLRSERQRESPLQLRSQGAPPSFSYAPISIPFSETLTFDNDNAFLEGGFMTMAFTFTLTEGKVLSFSSSNDEVYFILMDENGDTIDEENFTRFLPAGTYYLTIDDDGYHNSGSFLTANVSIDETNVTLYTALDYSSTILTDGSLVPGSFNAADNTAIGPLGDDFAGKGYSFTVEAGKAYRITCTYTSDQDVSFNPTGFYLFTGGTLVGDDTDVIGEGFDRDYSTTLTAETVYTATSNETIRLLLVDYEKNDLSYSIKIEEVLAPVSYTALDYSTLIPADGSEVTGSFTAAANRIIDFAGNMATGKGYSFMVEADKAYRITCTYTSDQDVSFNPTGFYLFTGGTLVGDTRDIIGAGLNSGYGTTLTATTIYMAASSETIRLLLFDFDMNDLSYSIKIEEALPPVSYTALDYTTLIPTDGTLVIGSFTAAANTVINHWGSVFTGKGYSFAVEAGKAYRITCTYNSVQPVNFNGAGFLLLTGGTLAGDDSDIIGSNDGTVIVTYTHTATSNETIRLLLVDYEMNDLSYSIKIEEALPPVSYTALDYSTFIPTDGTEVTGSFTAAANTVIDPWGDEFAGKGYSFTVEAGKGYRITANFFAPQAVQFNTGFNILTGGVLQGNDNDFIDGAGYWNYASEMTATLDYIASVDGTLRLLVGDYNGNDLMYSIRIEEFVAPAIVTLPELLDAATKEITYTANLEYTDSGTASNLVQGDEANYDFRYDGEVYYAEAYKIALAAGDRIEIHTGKPDGDSYLYIYKADGAGGYTYIDRNDDGYPRGLDSYINFTTTEAGDYYIVATDIDSNWGGSYFINVWNTADEPGVVISPISFEPVPIPYLNEQVDFTPGAGAVHTGYEYLRGFTFTLTEETDLYFYGRNELLGWRPNLYISQTAFDASLSDTEYYFINNDGVTLTLPAGTYYIALGDDGYGDDGYGGNYSTYLSISTESTKPEVTMPDEIKIEILSIQANTDQIQVASGATEDEILAELMKLVITGTTAADDAALLNNPYYWSINGTTATYMPLSAPVGYQFADDLQAITVTINSGEAGIKGAQADMSISLYPNPATNYVVIEQAEGCTLRISNVAGATICTRSNLSNSESIETAAWPQGIYLVQVQGTSGKAMRKLVKK